ncbi:cell division protein ZapE [Microbacteriaceae bacterium MWH-Ta3]|nr:cell division protein ZapE [Microbacteriaceae bacterium MWH-Ta3]
MVSVIHLVGRDPQLTTAQMLAHLTPPPQFQSASFESYRPDDSYPSQSDARDQVSHFFDAAARKGLFGKALVQPSGIYLDGGFGVGKTHLLAAAWHTASGRKYFGTFIEYTALVGALGYANAVQALKGASFIAIDEFELDDPGDTMLMTRLLGELMETGTKVMATSNTPPNALGEGRFAAADFLREIHALSARFTTLRIDGVDYRHRENSGHAVVSSEAEIEEYCAGASGSIAHDAFRDVVRHLARVHPSKYHMLIDGVDGIAWTQVTEFTDQNDALRFVALVDRLYDADIPIRAAGVAVDEIFPASMLEGGYRKKYLRAMSRLVALTHK